MDFQNPSVKYLIEFLAKFVGHIATVQDTEGDDPEKDPPPNPFLEAILERILKVKIYILCTCYRLKYICNFKSSFNKYLLLVL